MWRVTVASVFCFIIAPVGNHVPDPPKLGVSKADELCELADACMHDTIPVCGQMGELKRTFLDLCDLMEFGCDTNQVYAHIEGTNDCPNAANVRPKPKIKISRRGHIIGT